MGFIVGIVAALLVIFLLSYITIKKPVFGRALIALSIFLIILSIFFYFQKDQRVEKLKQLIPNEQIVLLDIDYEYAYGNYYKLFGSVQNDSEKYRLQAINFKLTFYQCPKPVSVNPMSIENSQESRLNHCENIEERDILVKTRLAPGHSGKFETYVLLDKERFSTLQWKIDVTSGIAR